MDAGKRIRAKSESGVEWIKQVFTWVCCSLYFKIQMPQLTRNPQFLEYTEILLGLEYLHSEDVVHGDLRGVSTIP